MPVCSATRCRVPLSSIDRAIVWKEAGVEVADRSSDLTDGTQSRMAVETVPFTDPMLKYQLRKKEAVWMKLHPCAPLRAADEPVITHGRGVGSLLHAALLLLSWEERWAGHLPGCPPTGKRG